MGMSLSSSTFFWKIFSIAKPAIENVYSRYEDHIMEVVRSHYQDESGLQLAAGEAYDSRGHTLSVDRGGGSQFDQAHPSHEVLHRSETGENDILQKYRVSFTKAML
ncbi:hypothetical protein Aduo_018932 [Ancylostoma duodenale]